MKILATHYSVIGRMTLCGKEVLGRRRTLRTTDEISLCTCKACVVAYNRRKELMKKGAK